MASPDAVASQRRWLTKLIAVEHQSRAEAFYAAVDMKKVRAGAVLPRVEDRENVSQQLRTRQEHMKVHAETQSWGRLLRPNRSPRRPLSAAREEKSASLVTPAASDEAEELEAVSRGDAELVEQVVRALGDPNIRESLFELGARVDSASGERAARLCAALRDRGGVEALSSLLSEADVLVHRVACMLLANLASAEVDPEGAGASVQLLVAAGAFPRLAALLFSEESGTVLYALGAVRNICAASPACAQALHRVGAIERLRSLAVCDHEAVASYAAGALINIELTLGAALLEDAADAAEEEIGAGMASLLVREERELFV